MKLIVFLGNPGRKYKKTRHNAGFIFGEQFSDDMNIKLKVKKFKSFSGSGKINGTDTTLLFPQTYMNNSGEAVSQAVAFFSCDPSDIIIVHDEIELPFGEIKTKDGGGHKGHNGIRSIISHLSTPDFKRIRFGVGRSDNPHLTVADYLLAKFTKEEYSVLENYYPQIKNALLELI